MKTFKLCALAALGLMAFGAGKMHAQISRLPFQFNDVQSLNISLTVVKQATNYASVTSKGTNNIAKTKTAKLDNKGLLSLLGLAYYNDTNYFATVGTTSYQTQIYLNSTNYYYDYEGDTNYAYESDYWPVQVVQVVGTTKTVVLDTGTADAFLPTNQLNSYATFSVQVDNGPLSGKSGTNSTSASMTASAYLDFYYGYNDNTNYNYVFNIYGFGAMNQSFSSSSKGDKYSFSIKNISGENNPETNGFFYVDGIITSGSASGSGKDSGTP
jgi:hypothetical protein